MGSEPNLVDDKPLSGKDVLKRIQKEYIAAPSEGYRQDLLYCEPYTGAQIGDAMLATFWAAQACHYNNYTNKDLADLFVATLIEKKYPHIEDPENGK